MNQIKSFSPTRVDLAGGTLDLWPLYNFLEKTPVTINLGIDIFTYANIKLRTDKKVVLDTQDLGVRKEYDNLEACLKDDTKDLSLLRCIVSEFRPAQGFELETKSESPVGGGLGGSSSLCISIIKAFCSWLNLDMEANAMVRLAHNIESRMLGTPTGTQDYYPPILGGMLALEYSARDIYYRSIDFPVDLFNDHIAMVYTGKPHVSGLNNWEVLKKAVEKDEHTLACLNELSSISHEMLEVLEAKNWEALPGLFDREYSARTDLSPVFTSDQIKRLKAIGNEHGETSVKICGAGGGGCVLLWTDPQRKAELLEKISQEDFRVLPNKSFLF